MAPQKVRKNRVSKNRPRETKKSTSSNEIEDIIKEYDFLTNPTAYFLNITSSDAHFDAQENHRNRYLATVFQLVTMKIDILPSAKVKMLCCAWSRKDSDMANTFLGMKKVFNFVEVAKAVNILDIPRQIKSIQKKVEKLKKLVEEKKITVKESTYKKFEKKIASLSKQKLKFGSVSGALCRHIREWASEYNQSELEFMAMNFETGVWKEMADVVHFNPSKTFSSLPWFLPYCYGQPAPDVSTVYKAKEITAENVNEILKCTPLPFHKISKFKQHLTSESKAVIVQNEDNVGRAIWWYEDMECREVDEVIKERILNERNLEFGYGKLMERLMMLQPKNVCFYPQLMDIAEIKLKEYTHNLEGPIGVFADASSSMNVAIRIATIISSFLTVFTNAQLVFFNDNYWSPEKNPNSISDVINLALNTQATNSTAPAAALWPFYENKTRLKTIILVTDEEENTKYENYRFAPLFKKYIEEVGPCELIFISFLSGQHCRGQMVEELRTYNIETTTYVLNSVKPDISKLDSIIGKMSLNTSSFIETISSVELALEKEEAKTVYGAIGQ